MNTNSRYSFRIAVILRNITECVTTSYNLLVFLVTLRAFECAYTNNNVEITNLKLVLSFESLEIN